MPGWEGEGRGLVGLTVKAADSELGLFLEALPPGCKVRGRRAYNKPEEVRRAVTAITRVRGQTEDTLADVPSAG